MINNLIEEFQENAKVHYEINYANTISIKQGNDAANKLYIIAEKLKNINAQNKLIDLLKVKEHKVDLWTAHILLEKIGIDGQIAEEALDIIRHYAGASDLNAYGEKIWLTQWEGLTRK